MKVNLVFKCTNCGLIDRIEPMYGVALTDLKRILVSKTHLVEFHSCFGGETKGIVKLTAYQLEEK